MAIIFQSVPLIFLQQVAVRVENGDGEMEALWMPSGGRASLCDNKWHRIVISKVEQMVSVQVDDNRPVKAAKGSKTVANVKDKLYLGGIPG